MSLLIGFIIIISNLVIININTYVTYLDLLAHLINFYELFKGGIIMKKSNALKSGTGANGVGTY